MAYDAFADLLENDTIIADAEDVALEEATKEKQIDTPLFTITFHNYQVGNTIVEGANGLFLGDLFNLCDRIVIRIATAIINAQELIFGLEAVATGTAKSISACFHENFTLKEEFHGTLDDTKLQKAAAYAAEIHAYMKTLDALIDSRAVLLPMARRGLQFAWNSEKQEPITNLKEALQYRLKTSSTKKSAEKRWADQKNNKGKTVKALDFMSLSDVLG
jgi:hypothetical protein